MNEITEAAIAVGVMCLCIFVACVLYDARVKRRLRKMDAEDAELRKIRGYYPVRCSVRCEGEVKK